MLAPSVGTLIINGGSVSTQDLLLGSESIGNGTVVVDAGTLDVTGNLTVAFLGTASLSVIDGGIVTTSDSAGVGQTVGSDGQVTVGILGGAGAASSWTITNTLTIGHGDAGQAAIDSGLVTVATGSTLTATNINIEDGGTLDLTDGGVANGTLNLFGGTLLNPGASPGTAVIEGDFNVSSGTFEIESNMISMIFAPLRLAYHSP